MSLRDRWPYVAALVGLVGLGVCAGWAGNLLAAGVLMVTGVAAGVLPELAREVGRDE